jgi:exodeoxyribonuclease VII small subunit
MASFEEKMQKLETVVDRLERGELPLEESVKLFEEGMKLSESCRKELEVAEGRIQVLVDQGRGQMKAADLEIESDGGGNGFEMDEGDNEEGE